MLPDHDPLRSTPCNGANCPTPQICLSQILTRSLACHHLRSLACETAAGGCHNSFRSTPRKRPFASHHMGPVPADRDRAWIDPSAPELGRVESARFCDRV